MTAINSNLALEIAEKHLNEMNPDMWNGEGNMPISLDERICTYEIGSDYAELDISTMTRTSKCGVITANCAIRGRKNCCNQLAAMALILL